MSLYPQEYSLFFVENMVHGTALEQAMWGRDGRRAGQSGYRPAVGPSHLLSIVTESHASENNLHTYLKRRGHSQAEESHTTERML